MKTTNNFPTDEMDRHLASCVLLLPGVTSGLIIFDNLKAVGFMSSQQKNRVGDNMQRQTALMEGSSSIHSRDDSNNSETTPSIPSSHQAEMDVMKLAQSHFSSQALVAAIQMGVFNVLDIDASLTVDEIIAKIKDDGETTSDNSSSRVRRDALFRCLRLVCTTGVLKETISIDKESTFSLTEMGQLLQSKHDAPSSMPPFFLHWAEEPIWNAWSKLPEFVVGKDIQQILKRRLIHHFKYDPHLIEQMVCVHQSITKTMQHHVHIVMQ